MLFHASVIRSGLIGRGGALEVFASQTINGRYLHAVRHFTEFFRLFCGVDLHLFTTYLYWRRLETSICARHFRAGAPLVEQGEQARAGEGGVA